VKRDNVSAELRRLHPPRSVLWVRRHICTGPGLTPATSAPGLDSPPPHLHRDWTHPRHICTGTGLTLPHLHRNWARRCHICAGAGASRATSASA
jgi:hypothetical protein